MLEAITPKKYTTAEDYLNDPVLTAKIDAELQEGLEYWEKCAKAGRLL
jgi:hypothetical protein